VEILNEEEEETKKLRVQKLCFMEAYIESDREKDTHTHTNSHRKDEVK
jgi:hypothetical protein